MKGERVYVAYVTHRHGEDVLVVSRDESVAVRALADFARAWWFDEHMEGKPPTEDAECARVYFEAQEGNEWGMVIESVLV